jgi:acyl-coenzyme A synthetase/AMP-(fatty) acid ligase
MSIDELTTLQLPLEDRIAAMTRDRSAAAALSWSGSTTSYGELGERVEACAALLDSAGLAPQEPVALLVDKSPEAIALVLACLRSRRRFLLPSTKLDPSSTARLFEQIGCRVAFVGDGANVSRTVGTGVARSIGDRDAADLDDVSFMLTTSGSTGPPKIVPIPRVAVEHFMDWAGPKFGIGSGSVVLNYAPLNFDLCFLDVWTTLASGGTVVLVTADESVRATRIASLITAHSVEVVQAVPMCFSLLSEVDTCFPTVRHAAFTGDAIAPRTLRRLPAQFPRAQLHNIYGCTETNDSFIHQLTLEETASTTVPIGHPIDGVTALVICDDGTRLDGPGQGELFVATPFQTAGYVDSTRNLNKFVRDPTGATADVYFRTGDIVERDGEGRIRLVGRTDFQVKVRGVAVNTAQIEAVLLTHPEVAEAAVAATLDPVAGHRLVCAVSRRPGSNLHSLAIRRHCSEHLPQAAIPSDITIVDRPLPTTSTGKPDRHAICRSPSSWPSPPDARSVGLTKEEMPHVP